MKQTRKTPRKTGEKVGYVLKNDEGRHLTEGFVNDPEWLSDIKEACVFDSVAAARKAAREVGVDDQNACIVEVHVNKRGYAKSRTDTKALYIEDPNEPELVISDVNTEKMLADLCADLEQGGFDIDRMSFERWLKLSDHRELLAWWKSKKQTETDRRRQLRISGRKKLTDEEAVALGVDEEDV